VSFTQWRGRPPNNNDVVFIRLEAPVGQELGRQQIPPPLEGFTTPDLVPEGLAPCETGKLL
jgi:hypothetical protein